MRILKLLPSDPASAEEVRAAGQSSPVPATRPPEPRQPAAEAADRSSVPPADDEAIRRNITCFVGGTMILTARGEMPVETLRAGELILTMHDLPCQRPLLRIRCSRIDLAQLSDPAAFAPVLIRAGALMKGSPIRDLRVSPGEGILLDGLLVPARLLVNGTTIRQESLSDRVAYYYVWMAAHDLLIADGALAESGFTDDWRRDYGGSPNVTAINSAGGDTAPSERCVPLLTEGPQLKLIQQRLALLARGSSPIH